MKPFRTLQDIQHQIDFISSQLSLNALQRPFHAEPEVDLLRCCAGGNVPGQLGNLLDLLDPGVDVGLQAVQEGDIGKERLRFDGFHCDSGSRVSALHTAIASEHSKVKEGHYSLLLRLSESDSG